ncbi:MAG: nicotinate phosphoribosyltransferase [Patescibacteria group bacterium]|nr:nicotinate phosphoribosyltransferase [Patescibacteria group bacterium]
MKNKRLINDSELPGFCLEHHFGLGTIFLAEGMENLIATFDLYVRDLPPRRNFLVAGGLEAIIDFIKNLRYDKTLIKHLLKSGRISKKFARYLENFSFSGDIYGLPEGTVHFPQSPIIRVTAPIIEAHLITDQLIALANIDTLLLTKLARVRLAARDIKCSIGFVRAHGIDAGWRAVRNSTFFENMGFNNVSAALRLGLKATSSAFNANHAYVKSFNTELESFRAAARAFPDSISPMFDTYDTKRGLDNVIKVADELKSKNKRLASVFVDSGNLVEVAKYARRRLDEAGYNKTKIAVASNLDEYKIEKFIKSNIPADMILLVTEVVTSADSPRLEMVYKIAQIEDGSSVSYTAKFSPGKLSLPGKKQVFRQLENNFVKEDIIGLENEKLGKPLLVPIFRKGRLVYKIPTIEQRRKYTMSQLSLLPERYKNISKSYKPPIKISKKIKELLKIVRARH